MYRIFLNNSSDEIYGCTDPEATNYNPDATVDDGSCEYDCSLGDVNCDGSLNVLDIVLAANMVLADEYDEIADVNGDGELNILDLVTLVNWVLYGDDGACIDIDGNIYETVQIDEQLWMAENLKVIHYSNGDEITNITSNSAWGSFVEGQYGVYDNDPSNADIYGNLYNWAVVDDDRGVCPDGWHVPSDEAYEILIDYLGGNSVAGGKMKKIGLEHWYSPNAGATNESGFTGLPSGFRYWADGNYYYMGEYNYFWTSSEGFEPGFAPFRTLRYDNTWVYEYDYAKDHGFSIRCLKD
jgi:uncharacterized protein (TIGR02145 family)